MNEQTLVTYLNSNWKDVKLDRLFPYIKIYAQIILVIHI
jgi:hypothetical protein